MRVDFTSMNEECANLWAFIDELFIYNTHEHLPPNKNVYRTLKQDILQEVVGGYLQTDLVSAGMRREDLALVLDHDGDIHDRWEVLQPYWAAVQNTGYALMADLGCEGLFGEQISGDSISRIDTRYRELLSRDFYQIVLKEKSRILYSLLDKYQPLGDNGVQVNVIDTDIEVEREYFKSVYRLDHFVFPRDWNDILQIESQFDISVNSLDDWLTGCELALENAIGKGVVAVKSALAYNRSLSYDLVTKTSAEREFLDVLRSRRNVEWEKLPGAPGVNFQNYVMHHILSLLESTSLPIQFHTGMQAGHGNFLGDSNPLLLSNLLLTYPRVNFVLLHSGYPFLEDAAAMAKMFPNAFLDLAWVHIISPGAVVRALAEWVHLLPENKVMAFGGDLPSIVCFYGHQRIARRNVYKALSEKVIESDLDLASAKRLAERWFVTNPKVFFRL